LIFNIMKKLMKFLDTLSRDEMRSVVGGYGPDDPLWCGGTWYECNCDNGGGFHAYMETSGHFMDLQKEMCSSGHMTCSC